MVPTPMGPLPAGTSNFLASACADRGTAVDAHWIREQASHRTTTSIMFRVLGGAPQAINGNLVQDILARPPDAYACRGHDRLGTRRSPRMVSCGGCPQL